MGIILIFMVAAAIVYCFLATLGAGCLLLATVALMHYHDPAWRWPGSLLLTVYSGVLLSWYWNSHRSDGDVPEGLRELWRQVETVVNLWPLIPATVALAGAGLVLLVQW